MKNFKQFYVKVIVKSSLFYYGFIVAVVSLLLWLMLSIRLDVIKTFGGTYSDGYVYIHNADETNPYAVDEINLAAIEKIYVYENRNEKLYSVFISETALSKEGFALKVQDEELAVFDTIGVDFQVDLPISRQSLFYRIFVKAGKRL